MKQYRVGLIRVLTTADPELLQLHGRLIEQYFPLLKVESRCIPDQPDGIHDDATMAMGGAESGCDGGADVEGGLRSDHCQLRRRPGGGGSPESGPDPYDRGGRKHGGAVHVLRKPACRPGDHRRSAGRIQADIDSIVM